MFDQESKMKDLSPIYMNEDKIRAIHTLQMPTH